MSISNAEMNATAASLRTVPASVPSGAASSTAATTSPDSGTNSGTASNTISGSDHEDFFHRLLDVINPLQHLPVVGTIYRAVTGDVPGAIEKIAGDTLYGGLWGAVGSVADTVFEAATGKDFGSTVLSLVTGDDDAPKVASAAGNKDFGDRLWAMFSNDDDDAPTSVAALTTPTLPGVGLPSFDTSSADMPSLPPAAPATIAASASASPNTSPNTSPDIAALTGALAAKGVDNDTAARALYAYRRSQGMTQMPVLASVN